MQECCEKEKRRGKRETHTPPDRGVILTRLGEPLPEVSDASDHWLAVRVILLPDKAPVEGGFEWHHGSHATGPRLCEGTHRRGPSLIYYGTHLKGQTHAYTEGVLSYDG